MKTIPELWASADALFAEGSALVEKADAAFERANDPNVADDFRGIARSHGEQIAMQARTRFKRHDMVLDRIAREQEL